MLKVIYIALLSFFRQKTKLLKGVAYMFSVGDKIVYQMHGAGVIDSIE